MLLLLRRHPGGPAPGQGLSHCPAEWFHTFLLGEPHISADHISYHWIFLTLGLVFLTTRGLRVPAAIPGLVGNRWQPGARPSKLALVLKAARRAPREQGSQPRSCLIEAGAVPGPPRCRCSLRRAELCVNYRKINEDTVQDSFSPFSTDDILHFLALIHLLSASPGAPDILLSLKNLKQELPLFPLQLVGGAGAAAHGRV